MKLITLSAMAASLLFSSAPSTEIAAATTPQIGGALALALAGAALLAAGFARRHKPATQGDVLPVLAEAPPQPSFFRENDMTGNGFSPNASGGAEVIEFSRARRPSGTPLRADGLPPILGVHLERRLVERAERVCGRYRHREEEDHAAQNLEV